LGLERRRPGFLSGAAAWAISRRRVLRLARRHQLSLTVRAVRHGTVAVTAKASAHLPDPSPANNTATARITITQSN